MIHPIVKRGNPLLHCKSEEITNIGQKGELITDLWDTLIAIQGLHKFTRGSGLAAPQIGELWRASVVEYDQQRYTLINPAITRHSDEHQAIREGCVSFL